MKHVLTLPWGADDLKEKYGLKTIKGGYSLYSGVLVPRELRPYRSEDFSLPRWTEDESNAHVSVPEKAGKNLKLTDQQSLAAEKILQAYEKNEPGFIIATPKATGKKLVTLNAVSLIAKNQGYKPWDEGTNKARMLIVTSKSFIPMWRLAIRRYPAVTALTRPLIISYNQLNQLLMAPPSARVSNKRSTKARLTSLNGAPTVNWDFIVFDEIHTLKGYPKNQRATSAVSVAKLNSEYVKDKSPFVIYSTDAPGNSPLDFALMSKILSPRLKRGAKVTPKEWVEFLKSEGFSISENSKGPVWLGDPPARGPLSKQSPETTAEIMKKDSQRLARAFRRSPVLVSEKETVKKVKHVTLPLELKGKHKLAYSEIWGDLKAWLNRHLMNSDPEGYAQQSARYFWRVSNLKHEYVNELVMDLLDSGKQVYLKVPTLEAASKHYEKFTEHRVVTSMLTSRNEDDSEESIELFKKGVARVLIVTDFLTDDKVDFGFSPVVVLTDSTMIPTFYFEREQFFPDRSLLVYLPYLERTVEEKLLELFVNLEESRAEVVASPLLIEKLLRTTAAKNTPPNRMS